MPYRGRYRQIPAPNFMQMVQSYMMGMNLAESLKKSREERSETKKEEQRRDDFRQAIGELMMGSHLEVAPVATGMPPIGGQLGGGGLKQIAPTTMPPAAPRGANMPSMGWQAGQVGPKPMGPVGQPMRQQGEMQYKPGMNYPEAFRTAAPGYLKEAMEVPGGAGLMMPPEAPKPVPYSHGKGLRHPITGKPIVEALAPEKKETSNLTAKWGKVNGEWVIGWYDPKTGNPVNVPEGFSLSGPGAGKPDLTVVKTRLAKVKSDLINQYKVLTSNTLPGAPPDSATTAEIAKLEAEWEFLMKDLEAQTGDQQAVEPKYNVPGANKKMTLPEIHKKYYPDMELEEVETKLRDAGIIND